MYFIPDFASFKSMSEAVGTYRRQFEEQYAQAVPAAADAIRRETEALRKPATEAAGRVRPGEGRAAALQRLAGRFESRRDYAGAALVYASGVIEAGPGSEDFLGRLDSMVGAASRAGGAPEAERACRALTLSGLPVFPKGYGRYARKAFAQLMREGSGEEAFKLALYWSTSCLSSLRNGGSIAGFRPPLAREDAEAAFAAWKGL